MTEQDLIPINNMIHGKLNRYQSVNICFFGSYVQVDVHEYIRGRPRFECLFDDDDRVKNIESLLNWLKE